MTKPGMITINRRRVSIKTATLAYRIWAYCQPSWGQTYSEVAEALDISTEQAMRVVHVSGFSGRFTGVSAGYADNPRSSGRQMAYGARADTALQLEEFRRRLDPVEE